MTSIERFFETKSKVAAWLPPVLWAGVIFTLSTINNPIASQFFVWDFIIKKIAHVTEYAILYILLLRATRGNYALSLIITFLYSISDEVHQGFVPGRSPAVYDIGLDMSGAAIAGYAIWKLKLHPQRKHKK
ncbi:hypothetical protein A2870_02800 [Candidatus Curtissbacteria bacterium RIFCSPHIGHO2_01_FULL_41_11]|uniref:VanZ-like domain-containing protein n=1 Tax=Candidatus Curtissbacteria bacterium RIFCSPHIGHO2_01_FULL_41_11 TaxID=1797711 RepID=A0A1F5G5C6_9BACT|nr:MAG: hypothetical protein A2870_02800 [Candidatus Curtissbacteria bacterium RIFCSPHIGHO2_01_FULL_41_11]